MTQRNSLSTVILSLQNTKEFSVRKDQITVPKCFYHIGTKVVQRNSLSAETRSMESAPSPKMQKSASSSLNEEKLREAALRNDLGVIRNLLARKTNPNSRNEVRDFQFFKLTE